MPEEIYLKTWDETKTDFTIENATEKHIYPTINQPVDQCALRSGSVFLETR